MMAADASSTAAMVGKTPGTVRVTSSGKIRYYVAYALDRLRGAPTEPLVLRVDSTTAMSRLISVAEIIKREYLSELDKGKSARLCGLHQYNHIGYTEGTQTPGKGKQKEEQHSRPEAILDALSGSKHIVQRQLPWMSITLSLEPLVGQEGSYQPPLPRNLTKSAKTRAKKRARAEARASAADASGADGVGGAPNAGAADGAPAAAATDGAAGKGSGIAAPGTVNNTSKAGAAGNSGAADDAMDTTADGATAGAVQSPVKPSTSAKKAAPNTQPGKRSAPTTQPITQATRTPSAKNATRTQPPPAKRKKA